MSEQKTFEFESIPESQNVTIDPLSASEVKTNTTKEDNEGSIKYPHYFRISKESLVNIVEDYTRRDFSQEIDRLEAMGGGY
jgi:predicted transglutaminase-like protease